ncbi:MAG: peptidoglycan editing factor PgeF [Oscillospiraceae bacterium]|nr:peptidoglycan editing factor PgeF [Oscillospiraceae bacterium]
MFIEESQNGLPYMRSTLIPAFHAFTTRCGGVSGGEWATLNLGSNRGDDPAAVRENYRRVCALFGAGVDGCAVTKQVHGAVVRIVTGADRHRCLSPVPYEADGIVTNEPGLPLFCFTADCVPALLCDAEHGVIAAVHCGWRSSVADILGEALRQMRALGAEAGSVCAALGPAIGRCCFETDADVPEAVGRWLGGDTAGLFDRRANGKYLVDLRAANARRLRQLGVAAERIDVSEECTFCLHEKYWSHRYTRGRRGSQAAGIVLGAPGETGREEG